MLPADAPDYVVIGHVAKDLIPGGHRLGGTAAFAALTARALGRVPGLVTAYGPDLAPDALRGIACARAPGQTSTTFENVYTPTGRVQHLRARAAPLSAGLVPPEWRKAPILHFAPLAQELEPDMLAALPGPFAGVTPQGWLRAWDAAGRVQPAPWAGAESVLAHASAVVISLEDIGGDWALARQWARTARVLVVTQGPQGCAVFAGGAEPVAVPVEPHTEVDPTGAGDIFATAFFIALSQAGQPVPAAVFANQVAAASVTQVGLAGVPDADEARRLWLRAGLPDGALGAHPG